VVRHADAQPGSATVPYKPERLDDLATDAQCNIATEFRFWYRQSARRRPAPITAPTLLRRV
jgi:hypothetical protein